MSKLIAPSFALILTLTLAGAASARQPPALSAAQERVEAISATCAEGPSSAGYRDMLARVASARPAPAAEPTSVATRKMGNHLVLVCAGGELHEGSGYRDFPTRLRAEPSGPQIASAARLVGRR